MTDTENELNDVLKEKRICRFCLTQEEPLSNIYSSQNRKNSRAPLPLQIMACVSIEVFTNDGMPNTVCDPCRLVMDYCYRFKQMCKKSDTSLKQFPLTGIWPNRHELPSFPQELLPARFKERPVLESPPKVQPKAQPVQILNKRKPELVLVTASQPKKITKQIKIENDSSGSILNLVSDYDDEPVQPSKNKSFPPKLLNQSVKILNKQAPSNDDPLAFQNTIVTKNYGGNMVTEILMEPEIDQVELEAEAINSAVPVETNVFPCPNCERSFPLRQLLDLHMANHVRDRKFACEVCQKAFFSKYDLSKHLLIHTGEKPFQCVVCEKAFSRSTLLRRHEKVHIDQPKFLCVHCERPFLSKDEMEKHTVNHLKSRPFVCSICNKGFAFKQGLERHEVVHSNVQPFQCEHCDQSFSTQSKLARHLTAHAGSRPYPCRICPKSYLLSHHLTRHLRSHKDSDLAFYKCSECSDVFDKHDDLIYHSAVHATENLTCPLCKEQFDSLDDVTEHIKSHTEGDQYACEFCDSIFVSEEKLRDHCDQQHADDIAFYDKDDKARQSTQDAFAKAQANASLKSKKSKPKVEVLEEYIISDAIIVNEDGQNVIDKQLISQHELAQFGSGQLEFETDDGIIFTISNDEAASIVKQEEKPEESDEPPQKRLKSYLQSERKSGRDEKIAVQKAEVPAAKSKSDVKLSPPKKLASTPVTSTKLASITIPNQTKAEPKSSTSSVVPVQINRKSPNTRSQKVADVTESKIVRVLKNSPIISSAGLKSSPTTIINNKTVSGDNRPSPKQDKSAAVAVTPPSKVTPITKAAAAAKVIPPSKANLVSDLAQKKPTEMINMKIGDKMVKVQQIRMSKSQVAAMAKEGKIEMKGGQMILRQGSAKKQSP